MSKVKKVPRIGDIVVITKTEETRNWDQLMYDYVGTYHEIESVEEIEEHLYYAEGDTRVIIHQVKFKKNSIYPFIHVWQWVYEHGHFEIEATAPVKILKMKLG